MNKTICHYCGHSLGQVFKQERDSDNSAWLEAVSAMQVTQMELGGQLTAPERVSTRAGRSLSGQKQQVSFT